MDAGETLKKLALEIGFDLAGVAPVDAAPDLAFAREWVQAGRGGEMRYLANPKRDDPRFVLPSAQSIVCVGLIYNAPHSEERRKPSGGPNAWISRYAWGRDYHDVMRTKLERLRKGMETLAPGVETRVYVDTGPIIERAFARLSGIGWVGKNTCLIHPQKGSWFFLGVILSNLALKPDLPAPDRCGSCTRCIEACPTEALTPYIMDASRCIAYLTIELKGSIPEAFRPAIGNNIFGCDICQDVCPWNRASPQQQERRGTATTDQCEFQPLTLELPGQAQHDEDERSTPATTGSCDSLTPDASRLKPERVSLFNPPLSTLASISEKDFRRAFSHSPIKRAKYRGWLRNLCVAIGNSGDQSFIPWLEQAARHEDEIVREHARWALERLGHSGVRCEVPGVREEQP